MTAALPAISIDDALADPELLGAALAPDGDLTTWQSWRVGLKAAFGIGLNRDEARAFASVAGSRKPPERRVRELWAIIGRRSGKSRVAALIAAYIAAFIDHSGKLAPGEVGTILVLAASKLQAQVVFNYIKSFFEESLILRAQVTDITADEIRLVGNVSISVHTNNYRTVRGRTLLGCVFDEVGFWRDENSSQPDVETYRAILPALATTKGMLVGISSPYAQRGLLYSKHRDCFGKDDADVLVIQAGTRVFNPTIDAQVIEDAKREDPESAAAEWDALFRSDLSTFVDRKIVEQCVERDRHERGFVSGYRYSAFTDVSGGQHDSFTVGVSHKEGERVLLDVTREWRAPFDPAIVVDEAVKVLRAYRCTSVRGDKYAGQWVASEFSKHGIHYIASDKNRSEIYLNALPLLMSGNAVLLDNTRLVSQIAQLERRTMRSGHDSVDHMRGSFDDLANAALGSLVFANERRGQSPLDHRPPLKVVRGYERAKQMHWRHQRPIATLRQDKIPLSQIRREIETLYGDGGEKSQ